MTGGAEYFKWIIPCEHETCTPAPLELNNNVKFDIYKSLYGIRMATSILKIISIYYFNSNSIKLKNTFEKLKLFFGKIHVPLFAVNK